MSYIDLRDVLFKAEMSFPKKFRNLFSAKKTSAVSTHKVHVWTSWNNRAAAFARQVEGKGATLFQSEKWLANWYETFATTPAIEPVIIAIESRQTGQLIMLLPLCKHKENGLSIISFADLGLADYNAPLLHPDYDLDTNQTTKLLHDICKALPSADLLKLEKIPQFINGKANPVAALAAMQPSTLSHYGIEITGSWDEYWSSLKRNFRKDQRRRWRVLEKKGVVSFRCYRNSLQALTLFDTLIKQQQARLAGLDLPYLLDDKRMRSFYQKAIEEGCVDNSVIFTALLVDGNPVATLCGLGDGHHYAMTLSGYETGEWSKCSPGRLLTERTMQYLHETGTRYFDFTIGDEPYKKYFAIEQGTLLEFTHPLSLKALPRHGWMKLKALQRKSALVTFLKKWLRKR
ncbi:MAG: GNAT family N-acetyltransferase [Hyphomicrobiaceae bacterium]|nr:GNAT family N-acetyltransferase [Hyphomicrobiaceae bacterium]